MVSGDAPGNGTTAVLEKSKMVSMADESPPPSCPSLSSCPPIAPTTTAASLLLLLGLLYGTCWSLVGDPVMPGGSIFALLTLGVVSYLGGRLIRLLRIPTLVGMMVVGFVLRNCPYINVAKDIPEDWAGNIRNCALVLILLRAGLEVDSDVLKRRGLACSQLIFIPFVVECCTAAVAAHFLFNMTWIWCFLLGFMLSAVSPAVVLPVMLKLQKKGIGSSNGIPTMVIAVAGIDDVLAVTGFEVVLGLVFATGTNLGWTIAQGPLQVLIGIVYGVVLGIVTWYLPNPEEKSRSVLRFLLLTFGGLFVLFVSHAFEWGATGALGCICFPFVAALRWKQEEWDPEENPVGKALSFIWRIIEPFLFGLVGSEIRMEYLDPSTVGLGLATLFIALALRTVACLLAAYIAGFTLKEQIFVTFAGLPKATVQAAIGPVALAYVRKLHMGPEIERHGIEILTVAVLSILITAPLGATAISLLAPRLLGSSNSAPDCKASQEKKPSMIDGSTILTIYTTKKSIDTKPPSMSFSSEISEFMARL